jgi:hypothetical protein
MSLRQIDVRVGVDSFLYLGVVIKSCRQYHVTAVMQVRALRGLVSINSRSHVEGCLLDTNRL